MINNFIRIKNSWPICVLPKNRYNICETCNKYNKNFSYLMKFPKMIKCYLNLKVGKLSSSMRSKTSLKAISELIQSEQSGISSFIYANYSYISLIIWLV